MNTILFLLQSLFVTFLVLHLFFLASIGITSEPNAIGSFTYFKMSKLKLHIDEYNHDCDNLENIYSLIDSQQKCWNGPYLRPKGLIDKFGNEFIITKFENLYIITSKGEDSIFGTMDDINSNDTKYKRIDVISYYSKKNINSEYLKAFYALLVATLCLVLIKLIKNYNLRKLKNI